jgi:hypothetical protein
VFHAHRLVFSIASLAALTTWKGSMHWVTWGTSSLVAAS